MSNEPQHEEMIKRATAALILSQEDARQLAERTGTPFIAGEEMKRKKPVAYRPRLAETPVIRETPKDDD